AAPHFCHSPLLNRYHYSPCLWDGTFRPALRLCHLLWTGRSHHGLVTSGSSDRVSWNPIHMRTRSIARRPTGSTSPHPARAKRREVFIGTEFSACRQPHFSTSAAQFVTSVIAFEPAPRQARGGERSRPVGAPGRAQGPPLRLLPL